ncbi:hypothetical protein [Streptomyces sp. NPDC047071]|uniref:TetR/AcrR family transcriptional regulator n=1 Tax=Streptomyces sp. NPDC047071 TaxID=3154808 RepID=UPI0034542442
MSSKDAGAPAPRPGGRPRDPAIEEAILKAVRARIATDGCSRLTIGYVVADTGVTRPTPYRRWAYKRELVVDALHYGLRKQHEAHPPMDVERMTPLESSLLRRQPAHGAEHPGRSRRPGRRRAVARLAGARAARGAAEGAKPPAGKGKSGQ